jgi:hypothetical protein
LYGQAADGTFAEALLAVPPFGAGLPAAVFLCLLAGRPEVGLGSGTASTRLTGRVVLLQADQNLAVVGPAYSSVTLGCEWLGDEGKRDLG